MNTTDKIQASLSIRISADGLSFCSYAPREPQPYTYKEYRLNHTISMAANLKIALQTERILRRDYKRVNILVASPLFTTMPLSEFQEARAAEYYHIVFPEQRLSHVSYNILRRSGIVVLFSLDSNVYRMLIDEYTRDRFYSSAATLTEFFGQKSPIDDRASMFAYIGHRSLSLYCFRYGNLLFANSYKITSSSDCQFYIMSVFKALGFDQLDDSLEIVSDREDIALPLSGMIVNFVANTRLLERNEDFKDKITEGNRQIPYDMQTLLVCGY